MAFQIPLILLGAKRKALPAGDSIFGSISVSVDYVHTVRVNVIKVDATGAARLVTLLDPAVFGAGNSVTIIKTDSSANVVTIDPASGNVGLFADYPLLLQNESVTLVSDGSNYLITGKYVPVGYNSPVRTLGTAFQISTRRDYVVHYSVRVNNTSSGANQTGRVELRTSAANPPLTSQAQTRVNQNIGGLLSGGLEVDCDNELTYTIKAGDYVNLVYVSEAGSGNGLVVLSRERPI